jgi:hypothetical protein
MGVVFFYGFAFEYKNFVSRFGGLYCLFGGFCRNSGRRQP